MDEQDMIERATALGVRGMLLDAIGRCRRADARATGRAPRMPREIVLHPEIYMQLRQELRPEDYLCSVSEERMRVGEPPAPWGVPIRVDATADRPKLITADNVVEYL